VRRPARTWAASISACCRGRQRFAGWTAGQLHTFARRLRGNLQELAGSALAGSALAGSALARSGAETLPTLGATGRDDLAAVGRLHPGAESVRTRTLEVARLEGALHGGTRDCGERPTNIGKRGVSCQSCSAGAVSGARVDWQVPLAARSNAARLQMPIPHSLINGSMSLWSRCLERLEAELGAED